MKKISREDIKNFWEEHKKKIIAGTVAAGGLVVMTGLTIRNIKRAKNLDASGILKGFNWDGTPTIMSRPIPETELFKILDIAEDVNDGCVVWLDGCKLADCGKVGEELCKIARVTSDMVMPMVILGKDEP